MAYHQFPEDITCAVLFNEIFSRNIRNAIKILRIVFKKMDILKGYSEGMLFY
jgi:hypothetical protein